MNLDQRRERILDDCGSEHGNDKIDHDRACSFPDRNIAAASHHNMLSEIPVFKDLTRTRDRSINNRSPHALI
jgi:hypothetical protein